MKRPSSARGREARQPTEIPSRGWWDIVKRVKGQLTEDHVQIVSAGVAFYFFFSLFPALAATVSVYGLVMDPAQVREQFDQLAAMLPEDVRSMIAEIATNLTGNSSSALGWGVALSILLSLWSANKGTQALFKGLNIAYDEQESRGFIKLYAVTLCVTLCAILTGIIMMALVVGFPAFSGMLGLPPMAKMVADWARWPFMALLVAIFLALIYRLAPDREKPKWRWVTTGSVVATTLWLGGSALFSYYVDHFGKYGDTYGAFAAVIILMLWFLLTSFIILLGAEINSEMEHQTEKDTTTGPSEPMGERGAYHADHVAGDEAVKGPVEC